MVMHSVKGLKEKNSGLTRDIDWKGVLNWYDNEFFKWRLIYIKITYQKLNVIEYQMLNFIVNKYQDIHKTSKEGNRGKFSRYKKFIYLILIDK